MLPIRPMIQIHKMLYKHLPPDLPDSNNVVKYVHSILDSMIDSGESTNFMDIILLTSGKSLDTLEKLDKISLIRLFLDGFFDNDVLGFFSFMDSLGFKDARNR